MTLQLWQSRQADEKRQDNTVDFAAHTSARTNRRYKMQQTLAAPCVIAGVGLHSGAIVTMHLLPAETDTGITFVRMDKGAAELSARFDKVTDTVLCTKLSDGDVSIGTVEHLMSALRALEIDNLRIEIDGPEVPIMDGSAQEFVAAIRSAGTLRQDRPRQVIRILKTVTTGDESRGASLLPADRFTLDFEIRFDSAAIGTQRWAYDMTDGDYAGDLGNARTFGFFEEVEYLRSKGLARGGSLENAIVIQNDAVMNKGGLRYDNEFVRHKTLDAIGDLYLSGLQIQGHYQGVCAGHEVNNNLLRTLFADPRAWVLSYQTEDDAALSKAATARG